MTQGYTIERQVVDYDGTTNVILTVRPDRDPKWNGYDIIIAKDDGLSMSLACVTIWGLDAFVKILPTFWTEGVIEAVKNMLKDFPRK